MSKGQLQPDMWGLTEMPLGDKWNWSELRSDIAQHGVRNSLLVAPMPTASTSQVRALNAPSVAGGAYGARARRRPESGAKEKGRGSLVGEATDGGAAMRANALVSSPGRRFEPKDSKRAPLRRDARCGCP